MSQTESMTELRESLKDQLHHLVREVEALAELAGRIPDDAVKARPLSGDLSVKEMYGLLAAADEQVFTPLIAAVATKDDVAGSALDPASLLESEDWNSRTLLAILERVAKARTELLESLANLPDGRWDRSVRLGEDTFNVFGFAHFITQHDADVLRKVGYRLHDARLFSSGTPATGRDTPLK